MGSIFQSFIDLMAATLNLVIEFLPTSPFSQYINDIKTSGFSTFLGYLNYFVPISVFVKIGISWLSAIAVYYVYSVILRWVKMID